MSFPFSFPTHAAHNKHRRTHTKLWDNHEALWDSLSQDTEPGGTHHRVGIQNTSPSTPPVPGTWHGLESVAVKLPALFFVSLWPCWSSSWGTAEIIKQLLLIGPNKPGCREGERKVKEREVEEQVVDSDRRWWRREACNVKELATSRETHKEP